MKIHIYLVKKKIGLGTWSWGNKVFWNYSDSNDQTLRETFREALKRGFSFIDTADTYGTGQLRGRSEQLLGNFLSEIRESQKNRFKIATKLAPYPWRVGRSGFTKPFLDSLDRLNGKLDIVQLHWSTAKYNPWQEYQLLNNLSDLIDHGYRFKIGLSNIGPKKLAKMISFLEDKKKRIDCVQVQFSLLSPDINKQRLVKQICELNNIDFLAYSPLSFGLLATDPNEDVDKDKSLLRNLIFNIYKKSTTELRNTIKDIANSRSVSMAQVAINWCLYQGAIPIVGLRKKSQVIDIAYTLKWDLKDYEFDLLEMASSKCKQSMPSNPFSSN